MRFLNQEKADCLRDGVFDISEDDVEVGIYPFSHFLHEDIAPILWWGLSLLLLGWLIRIIWVTADWWTLAWYDIRSIGLVSYVVSKQVVLFGVNDSLYNFSGSISFLREDLHNNVHDFWDHRWESLENLLNNVGSNRLELRITILNKFQCWIPEFFKLWRYQVNKNIN